MQVASRWCRDRLLSSDLTRHTTRAAGRTQDVCGAERRALRGARPLADCGRHIGDARGYPGSRVCIGDRRGVTCAAVLVQRSSVSSLSLVSSETAKSVRRTSVGRREAGHAGQPFGAFAVRACATVEDRRWINLSPNRERERQRCRIPRLIPIPVLLLLESWGAY